MKEVSLGELIRTRRKSRGLTRAELAHRVGRESHTTIGRWENNEVEPGLDAIEKLRFELGISIEELDQISYRDLRHGKLQMRIEGREHLRRTGKSYLKMLREIVSLDYETIGYDGNGPEADYEGKPEMWAEVFRRYSSCWRNLVQGDEIVGNWHYIPLARETFEMAKRGEYVESKTLCYELDTIDFPDEDYLIYFTALVAREGFREGEMFLDFFNSIFWSMLEMAKKKIFISEVVSYAWTPESRKICSKRLNMENIGDVVVGGKSYPIYWAKTTTILESHKLREHAELRSLYEARYSSIN